MSSRVFPLVCRAPVPVFFVRLACARLLSNKVSLSLTSAPVGGESGTPRNGERPFAVCVLKLHGRTRRNVPRAPMKIEYATQSRSPLRGVPSRVEPPCQSARSQSNRRVAYLSVNERVASLQYGGVICGGRSVQQEAAPSCEIPISGAPACDRLLVYHLRTLTDPTLTSAVAQSVAALLDDRRAHRLGCERPL